MTDGTNYFIESPFYQLTPPSPNPFTGWLNQGTATEEAIGTSLVMYNASGSGVNLRTVAMGGNTTATAVLIPVLFGFGTGVNPNACIFFREASSHHVLAFTVGYNNSNSVTVGTWYMTSDGTGFGAVLTSPAIGSWPNPLHYVLLQIKVSGSNVLGYASVDGGLSWNNYFAEAKTAHFTTGPDTWGYCYVNSGSAVTSYSVLASWSVQ